MSLISPKHLAAPFSNKVHLITILLVSILFATYRLAGGALESKRRESLRTHSPSTAGMTVKRSALGAIAGGEEAPAYPQARTGGNAGTPDDSVGELLRPSAKPKEKPAEPPSNSLDDIEKRLGLR